MPALTCSATTISRGALAVQAVCGCRSGRVACIRMRRMGMAAVRGRRHRTYTAIPLPYSRALAEARVGSPNTPADAGVNSAPIESMRTATPALSSVPFTTTSTFSSAAASTLEQLRIRQTFRPALQPASVRVPRLLVFGGDVVSVTALEALHTRMRCIVASALRRLKASDKSCGAGVEYWPPSAAASSFDGRSAEADTTEDEEAMADVDAFVRDHITVVCPALPRGMTPEEAAKKFTRQYPVTRYCIKHGLPIIPVDDPRSLSQSTLLKEMLSSGRGSTASTTDSRAHHLRGIAALLNHRTSHALSSSAPRCEADAAPLVKNGQHKRKGTSPSSAPSTTPHTWAAQGRALADYDLAVVVSFRYFLPKRLLRVLPPVINMHPSLLPRFRGASPIFSALRRNETLGGVSIIQMKPEQTAMDSGSVLWQCEVPIAPDMDIRLYFPLVTQIGAAGLCDLIFGEAPPGERPSVAIANAPAPALPFPSACPSCLIPHGGNCSSPQTPQDVVECGAARTTPSNCATAPSWFTLRQRCLAPVVHRPGQHGAVSASAASSEAHSPAQMLRVAEQPLPSVLSAPAKHYPVAHIHQALHALDGGTQRQRLCSTPQAPNRSDAEVRHHRCRPPWMTLCRAPTHITPEVVHAASTALRALFFQNMEITAAAAGHKQTKADAAAAVSACQSAPVGKKTVSLTAAAEMGITTTMKCAEVFPASVLSPHCDWPDSFTYSWKFAQVQTYPTYAHFSEDPYHAPLLPKDAAVVRFSSMDAAEAFGVWRAFVGGDYFQPSVSATFDKGSTPVRNQLVRRALRQLLLKRGKAHAKLHGAAQLRTACTGSRREETPAATLTSASEVGDVPVGIVAGKRVDLDISNPAGLQLLAEAESTLRIPCTFTHVVNPVLAPALVREELVEIERTGKLPAGSYTCIAQHAQQRQRRRVRFYRAPQAIFRSPLCSHANGSSPQESAPRGKCQPRPATTEHGTLATDSAHPSLQQQRCEVDGESDASASFTKSSCTTSPFAAAEKGKRPPGHRRPSASGAATAVLTEEQEEDEEAPEDYVPEVIHAAPPTQHHVHIPPGTGYFPESDESFGAVKCKEGWLLWKEAHMKWANRAQPAVLIRKGLAMKTGVLYVGLFSEYS
ncbi:hypothetical protein GH5_03200 [Leishmania sp. Ghana 2012 LV757]|uniref:hypothetical protein n=1 Tax=Leishmania sp. Ghana 2012 LV757 TaxID=2803181 RepID=UPI001B69677E|nr:hypothetical protein GH5_03200 [Leishmania sp. Ghana 2012 LV757]